MMKTLGSLFFGAPAWLQDTLFLAFLVGIVFEAGRGTAVLLWRLLVATARAIRKWGFE